MMHYVSKLMQAEGIEHTLVMPFTIHVHEGTIESYGAGYMVTDADGNETRYGRDDEEQLVEELAYMA